MTQPLARHKPLFGVSVEPVAEQVETIFEVARIADEQQLDLLAVQDHPYLANYLDAWTLLVVLATSTNHMSVMPNGINLAVPSRLSRRMRPPAITRGSASTAGQPCC